jgi:hypothetical protein
MRTNKLFLLIAASLMSGALCAASAMADAPRPEAYQRLTAVELQPGHAPRLNGGFQELSGNERRYSEKLPMQLEGAIKKVKAAKYKPQRKPKHKRHKPKTLRF